MSAVPDRCDALRRVHLIAGLVTLAGFALTGQYMHWVHAHLAGMPEGPRLFYKSAHIYLLWSGLVHTMLGCYLTRIPSGVPRRMQLLSSLILLTCPALLAYSFFAEPYNPDQHRPAAWWANVLALIGVTVQLCAVAAHRIKHGNR